MASGHPETSLAGAELLRAGGNAFDAALGAMCAACVAEPLLVSLGGGGFLLSSTGDGREIVHDFFCQTPRRRCPAAEADFFPILADFGTATQEFHIGMGSIAVPGVVAGLFEAHADLGRMPLKEIVEPAVALARKGVRLNALNAYVVRILEAILRSDPAAFAMYESTARPGRLAGEGERLSNPDLANAFEALAWEGASLFYRGEWARRMAEASRERGGHLGRGDFDAYRVERRTPLAFEYGGAACRINPPPSPGGCLIALALELLDGWLGPEVGAGDRAHADALVRAMHGASLARDRHGVAEARDARALSRLLQPERLAEWKRSLAAHPLITRGTSHISVADREGNLASLTVSNGEGSAYVLPGTGIMLNNMLGEEDLNPAGPGCWSEGVRLASMMSPMLLRFPDRAIALGSGGSNRIRSAIVQVVVNLARFGMGLEAAVGAPRLHLEGSRLSIESGWNADAQTHLRRRLPDLHEWPERNLFFGGVHAVERRHDGRLSGAGDPRRGGAVAIA